MGIKRRERKTQWRATFRVPIRSTLAMLAALALTVQLGAVASSPALAVTTPGVSAALQPATDTEGAIRLWRTGGPAVKDAARTALLGGPAGVSQFISTTQHTALTQDYRVTAIAITMAGGPAVRSAAETALSSTSSAALAQFISSGWRTAWAQDDRARVTELAANGPTLVKAAAQAALRVGTDEAISTFVLTGEDAARVREDRQAAYRLSSTGSPTVQTKASEALNSGDARIISDFLRYGQYVAAARDAEVASVSQLADQAKAASDEARKQSDATTAAAAQAVSSANKAKEATRRAADEAAAAAASTTLAGQAASRAAQLAEQAAQGAEVAVQASQDATRALTAAANSARAAAAAAARANEAAATAQNAAAAAATNASRAAEARQAAQGARNAAADARRAVDAASAAMQAVTQSAAAANAASSAGANARLAAQAATQVANQAGLSSQQAAQAREAARRANEAADRADAAAQHVATLATQATAAATDARNAANAAAGHADAAAAAADQAAAQAGNATYAASRAQAAATAARNAADAATLAVMKATQIAQVARAADTQRLDDERAFNRARAIAAAQIEQQRTQAQTQQQQESQAAAAETQGLVTTLTAPGANIPAQMPAARRAVFGLIQTGGQWVRAAAETALIGGDAAVVEFLSKSRLTAIERDQWEQAIPHAYDGPEPVQLAAQDALYSGPEEIATFIATGYDAAARASFRQQIYTILNGAGSQVTAAGNAALTSSAPTAARVFVQSGQYTARDRDDRLAAYQYSSSGTPEVQAAAQVALDGPRGGLRQFLSVGLLEARQRDQETSAHIAMVDSLIAAATADAKNAQAQASKAAQTAALARNAAAEAQAAANQAATHASNASQSASQARTFADNAEASATQARASAATARDAANTARNSAVAAAQEASNATASADAAQRSARDAAQAANAARASATAAGKDAAAAAKAATQALDFAAVKQQEEDEAGYLSRGAVDTTSATPSESEIAAARAAGGQAAVDELMAARQSLATGDLAQYLISIGGQLLLDFFGITDIVNCVTKGDIGACAMSLIGFLPIGKILQAGKAIALLGRLVPQIVEFFARHQDALRVVERYSGAACTVGFVTARTAASSASASVSRAGAIGLAAKSSCGGPIPVAIGQRGEAAVRGVADIGLPTSITINGRNRILDGLNLDTGVVTEIKNVNSQSYTRQLVDSLSFARQQEPKLKFDLYVRCASATVKATIISAPLQAVINEGLINKKCIP
ncbi:putative toxin [Microbacterium sp. P07]|uniref:putative toxin n=1 Tax=Microbacterium sp. P07 TaxID=3366952 RepID=UPI003746C2E1